MTTTTKRRIAVKKNSAVKTASPAGAAKVVSEKTGAVGFLDKAKGYYKGLIAAVGAILVIANELTPVFNFLPSQDKQYITTGIAFVAAAAVFLKDDEHWVDDL